MSAAAAMESRRSIRAFTDQAVSAETIAEILTLAARAPSGTNTQPWKVHVLTGPSREKLSARILEVFNNPAESAKYESEYAYYPTKWASPYIDRRRKVGWDLYGLLGLTRDDKEGMHAQHARNFSFFDAPVGLMFSIDRSLEVGSWLDYGMFLQSVMLAARAKGLDTCPQAAFTQFHQIISDELSLPESDMVVCGMSLGYANPDAIENSLITERESVANFATFVGF
ncbi:MAG: nitroreductase [Burkholderiaceae bacterium]